MLALDLATEAAALAGLVLLLAVALLAPGLLLLALVMALRRRSTRPSPTRD